MTDAHDGRFPDNVQDPGKEDNEAWQKGMGCTAVYTVDPLDGKRVQKVRCFTGIGAMMMVRSLT